MHPVYSNKYTIWLVNIDAPSTKISSCLFPVESLAASPHRELPTTTYMGKTYIPILTIWDVTSRWYDIGDTHFILYCYHHGLVSSDLPDRLFPRFASRAVLSWQLQEGVRVYFHYTTRNDTLLVYNTMHMAIDFNLNCLTMVILEITPLIGS